MVRVDGLRCEYLPVPMGVDTSRPRLSWRLTDPDQKRGRAQSAYQVQVERAVAGTRKRLWDSGKVASDQSVNVPYAGESLASAWDCRWRVRVWDERGNASPWGEQARFVMGLLDASAWRGEWVRAGQIEEHQHAWFRKTFELENVPSEALVYLCSIGYHELYVNGQRVGDAALTPGVTNLARRALYMTYDIASLLRQGENVIAVWTGPGWARADGSYGKGVWDQTAMFQAQVYINGDACLSTDTSWRCSLSSSENIGDWRGGGEGTYGGELIDARRDQPGWNTLGFDDAAWEPAVKGEQSVEISSALFEPDKKVKTFSPVSIAKDGDEYVIDFGENHTGWFEIDLRGGQAGDEITILTANRKGERCEYDQESRYIFGDFGEGTFCHRFNWHAGRWVTLVGLKQEPSPDDIRGYIVTNARARISHFECSDELLNQIFETDLRTYIANTVNAAVMDCPHRERYGYGEVALACTWGCAIPNFESAAMYNKVTRDWCDVQDDDGMINTIAPQPYHGAGGTLWSSAPLTATWEYYRAYGDVRQLERTYPTIRRWLGYLHRAVTDDGVLMPYTVDSRFLGDWATPHGNEYGSWPAAQLFNNCVYAYDLAVAIEMAKTLGREDDAATFQKRLDSLRECAHRYFYNEETGLYVDGWQQSLLFPLYTRITPEHLRERVFSAFVKELNAKGYLDTGSPGIPMMLKWVCEDLCKPDLLMPILQRRAQPGYGYFIERGETCWPEYWEVDGIASRIHTCYTSISGYHVRGIGGIQPHPDHPGMQRVLIRPGFVDELTYADTTTASLYGPITCNWSQTDTQRTVRLEIPPNTTAQVHLPAAMSSAWTDNGRPIEQAPGIQLSADAALDPGGVVLELAAGAYTLSG